MFPHQVFCTQIKLPVIHDLNQNIIWICPSLVQQFGHYGFVLGTSQNLAVV